jgi:cellulose synthase/poly-beta-1,6-N-acetylglucosamine synthase-like glycosyltransferase
MVLFGWRKWLERTCFVTVSLGLVLLGVVQGFQTYSFTLDFFSVAMEVLLIDAVASSFFFTGFILISGGIFFIKAFRSGNSDGFSDSGDKISCIIPNYYDSNVMGRAVQSILESSYNNFEVLVVCVEGDSNSISKMEEFSEDDRVDYVVNDKDQSSKAENVNRGIEEVDADLIAIFDADQTVNPGFLSKAAGLTESYDVIQGRHLPLPEGIISSLAYYESLMFDYVARQLNYVITDFRLAGSNCMLAKRKVFEKVGGYDKTMLTEDFDFSHRCYKHNINTTNIQTPVTETEASHSIKDWWGQRKRWMTGYFQVFAKLVKKSFIDFKGYRTILSLIICGVSITGSLLMLTLVSKFVILFILGADTVYLLPLSAVLSLSLVGRIYDKRSGNLENIGWIWLLTPLIFPLFSLVTVKAFFEFLLNPDIRWYTVEKG